MRRMCEYSYMGVLIGSGLWLVIETLKIMMDGFNELNTQGVKISLSALVILIVIRALGSLGHRHTRVYVALGISAVLGGILGLGSIVTLIVGIYVTIQGFQHWKEIQKLPSREEVKVARGRYLEGLEKELEEEEREKEREREMKVASDILEGFKGSDDHRREIETWIVEEDFNKTEYTEEEIRAIARQEVRENKLSIETILALGELTKHDKIEREEIEDKESSVGFKVFTIEGMEDLEELEEVGVENREDIVEKEEKEEDDGNVGDISLEDILGDKYDE